MARETNNAHFASANLNTARLVDLLIDACDDMPRDAWAVMAASARKAAA